MWEGYQSLQWSFKVERDRRCRPPGAGCCRPLRRRLPTGPDATDTIPPLLESPGVWAYQVIMVITPLFRAAMFIAAPMSYQGCSAVTASVVDAKCKIQHAAVCGCIENKLVFSWCLLVLLHFILLCLWQVYVTSLLSVFTMYPSVGMRLATSTSDIISSSTNDFIRCNWQEPLSSLFHSMFSNKHMY